MKTFRTLTLPVCLAILIFSFAFTVPDKLKLAVEPNHSTIQFAVPISGGLTRITGKFTSFSIDIDLIDDNITKSSVAVKIKTASVNTGIPGRDEELTTKDFFESDKYPDITFVSDSIRQVGDGYIAYGTFQMHGISKKIELPFSITGKDGDATIGFTCRYKLKRSDYGVGTSWKHTTEDNFIGNEIGVEIDFWTKKKKEQ